MAVRLYETVVGKEIIARQTFVDTNDINVQKMGGLGVVTGVGNNKFSPDGTITREQSAVILANLMKAIGMPLDIKPSGFSDNANISSWAITAVGQIQAAGIMSGTGNNMFSPKANYMREQSIVTLLQLYDLVNEKLESYATKVLELTNIERIKAGLPAYADTTLLRTAASIRAKELGILYSHDRPDGRDGLTILSEVGISYMAAGENIASGYETPEQVVTAWMNSEGYRTNILDRDFGKMGVGVYIDTSGNFY